MKRNRVVRAVRQPTSWLRFQQESAGENGDIVGGDIFDPTTLGVLGSGEDFELTVLRIRISCVFQLAVAAAEVANAEIAFDGFAGIALVGTDTTLPDAGLANVADTDTDWLALRAYSLSPNLVLGNVAYMGTTHFDFDVKAKRKVGIGEHIVLTLTPNVERPFDFTTNLKSICSVLWQRSAKR